MRNRYIENLTSKMEWQREEALKTVEKVKNETVTEAGIIKWAMGNFMPSDLVELAAHVGMEFDAEKTEAARDDHQAAFMADYIEAQANRSEEQLAEERFEMQAAFGKGERVVNVFTGKVTQL